MQHLTEVLAHVDTLAAGHLADDLLAATRLAAWFHDAVHDGGPDDEERSAVLAEQVLAELGVTPAVVADAARLVRLTVAHDPEPGGTAGEVLCDADLAVLARDRHGYAEYVATVRSEYAQYDDATFRLGRAAVLRDLLALPSLFRTAAGRDRWEAAARANVEREITELDGWSSA